MKVRRKMVDKTKVDRIRSQQTRESCGIPPINKWLERRRREWDEHVTRMDAERLVKISKNNIPAGRSSPGSPKRKWSDLIPDENRRNRLQRRRKRGFYDIISIRILMFSILDT